MEMLLTSFFAGILTILAPCVLPLLPVIIGGSLGGNTIRKPLIITSSLALSIFFFTLLIKVSTLILSLPEMTWKIISGGILIFFGIFSLFPHTWEKIAFHFSLGARSQSSLQKASKKEGVFGEILIGASLGPVFTSCSPTYILILATILPASLFTGIVYLLAYILGLVFILFLIAFFGQKLVVRMYWASDSHGTFKKVLGGIFLFLGVSILLGWDKAFESFLIDLGYGGIDY